MNINKRTAVFIILGTIVVVGSIVGYLLASLNANKTNTANNNVSVANTNISNINVSNINTANINGTTNENINGNINGSNINTTVEAKTNTNTQPTETIQVT